jgi:hypothetical protein
MQLGNALLTWLFVLMAMRNLAVSTTILDELARNAGLQLCLYLLSFAAVGTIVGGASYQSSSVSFKRYLFCIIHKAINSIGISWM